jgi:hypothetical protein
MMAAPFAFAYPCSLDSAAVTKEGPHWSAPGEGQGKALGDPTGRQDHGVFFNNSEFQ